MEIEKLSSLIATRETVQKEFSHARKVVYNCRYKLQQNNTDIKQAKLALIKTNNYKVYVGNIIGFLYAEAGEPLDRHFVRDYLRSSSPHDWIKILADGELEGC